MSKFLKRLLILLLIGLPGIVLLAASFAIQRHPLVAASAGAIANTSETRQLLQELDPRRSAQQPIRTVVLTEAQVNVLASQAARRWGDSALRIQLRSRGAAIQISTPIHALPFGAWVNVDATLSESGRLPRVEAMRIGRLAVPAFLGDWLLRRAAQQLEATPEGRVAADIVKRVAFASRELTLVYDWREGTERRVLAALVPPDDQERLHAYSDRLAELAASRNTGEPIPLEALLAPTFDLARNRSGVDLVKAARENRAALVALAFYATGRDLGDIVPAARSWRKAAPHPVTLFGRDDFPQHFLVSAAIAADAGGALTDAIGVYKEVADAHGGSGFSFNDIAADRAGTRFGLLAAKSPRQLADRVAAGVRETDFMPSVADLPEFLSEVEFKRRYGAIGSPAYAQQLDSIEKRLDAMPLLR